MSAKKTSKKHNSLPKSAFEGEGIPLPHKKQSFFKKNKRLYFYIGAILTLCFIVIISLYYCNQYQKNQRLLKNPLLASEMEQESIVKKVSQLIQLPVNEAPTIARVSDISKLQGQPFFKKAQNGDMVLIYPKEEEAILYNPSTNRIVNIGPISVNQQSVQGASTTVLPTTTVPVTVALYNGTTIAGLTKKIEQELVQQMPDVTVVQNTNAQKQDYIQTTIVDLTGKEASIARQLAMVLHGVVGTLPEGEVSPESAETDMVVILGTNY